MSQRYPSVDAYLRKAPAFAQPIIEHLREVVHAACSEVEECIKWNCPFFVYRGPVCAVAAFKAHCRIGFWKADVLRKGPAAAAALASLERVTQVSEFPSRAALTALVQAAVKLNEDGVLAEWQKAQQERRKNPVPVKPPPALAAALKKNARARKTWDAFTPSHRRDYVVWISALFNIRDGEKERTIADRSNLACPSRLTAPRENHEAARASPRRALHRRGVRNFSPSVKQVSV